MLPNQKTKMSSQSIVREMPKVEIEIESDDDIEDAKEIIGILETTTDKE